MIGIILLVIVFKIANEYSKRQGRELHVYGILKSIIMGSGTYSSSVIINTPK